MNGIYAQLGSGCDTSMSVLIDNTKFFPLEDPVYKQVLTRMYRYPGQQHDFIKTVGNPEKPEDIKMKELKVKPEYFSYRKGCCGRN